MWSKIIFILLIFPALIIPSCKLANDTQIPDSKLKVTATIFPLYDFARAVGGEKISVSMLLPPGADAHNYELKPEEIVKVTNSDVFLFINFEMEQWAYKIISAATEKTNMLAVETGKGTFLLPLAVAGEQEQDEYGGQHASRFDPHIWLDLANAQIIIDNITEAFINKDQANSDYYKNNARKYKSRLAALDKKYREELALCKSDVILHAGHWAFAYLAQRYKLKYMAAYSTSAEAEPLPQNIFNMVEQIKKTGATYIFYEDLVAPRLAQTMAKETGVGLLKLNNGHDIGKNDIKKGVTFLSLMEENLANLRKGLSCP
ncbi:MAG TPA: zinc ABC transporter substrate-binding protein [Smithellaceae bacterium]|jgi:zinc transport system substrate-binding protein|nr:MAG: High-affinity zinc uptake system binding-protein ZnuA precursor [Deltaproteobacteria bacterium ADurb.BinA014]HOD30804.1 zinc ABC transporter substrate-binding protein [Smithellaceae bacterium]HOZ61031.1 zinc ABC transporter substrate-binding protein [Smithellaceae bacterium]